MRFPNTCRKIHSWKKNFCTNYSSKSKEFFFEIVYWLFDHSANSHQADSILPVPQRTRYNFKNSLFPAFYYDIIRAKYIFFRNVFSPRYLKPLFDICDTHNSKTKSAHKGLICLGDSSTRKQASQITWNGRGRPQRGCTGFTWHYRTRHCRIALPPRGQSLANSRP